MIKSKDTLKTYFETGDIPTEPQFTDLIDSLRHIQDGQVIVSHTTDSVGNTIITLSDGRKISMNQIDSNGFAKQEIIPSREINTGWYTIAVNAGNRASAKFVLRDVRSSYHQMIHFYAGHHFGNGNVITVLSNSVYYNGGSIRHIRIKEGNTYDGAMLQVYIDADAAPVSGWILENYQDNGWIPKNWVSDGTNPGGVSNFAALTNVAVQIDLDKTQGINSSEGIFSNGSINAGANIHANGDYYYGDGKRIIQFSDGWLRINPANDFGYGIYCGSGKLRTDGQLEVGPNGNKFKVDSSGNTTASGNVTAYSDKRLKNILEPVKDSFLDKIDKLKPTYYQWKDTTKEQTKQLGFIAQEVMEVFPEWVHKSNEHYAMSYDKMGAVLAVKGTQELRTEMDRLRTELKELKAELKELKNGITK